MSYFTCPYCEAESDNTGDPYQQDESRGVECPSCHKEFLVTASYNVDYYCEALEDAAKNEDDCWELMKRFRGAE